MGQGSEAVGRGRHFGRKVTVYGTRNVWYGMVYVSTTSYFCPNSEERILSRPFLVRQNRRNQFRHEGDIMFEKPPLRINNETERR